MRDRTLADKDGEGYRFSAVVIGVSAGGLQALESILTRLPEGYPVPLLVVQHRSADSGEFLAEHLDGRSAIRVKDAEDKEPLVPSTAYLAPPGYHLLVEEDLTLGLSVDPPVEHSRPSVDVLFESAADVFGRALVGVILTGANADGSRGLAAIKRRGGMAIVEDPSSAYAAAMPRAAIEITPVDHILPIAEIAEALRRLPERL